MLFQRGGEGGRAGEEPLLQRLEHELGGELLGVVLAPVRLPQFGVLPQGGVDRPLLVGVGDLDGLQHAAWGTGASRPTSAAIPTSAAGP